MEAINKTLNWIRKLRDKDYETFKKDPLAYEAKQKKSVEEFKKKYMTKKKKVA